MAQTERVRRPGWPGKSKAVICYKDFSGTRLTLSSANKSRKITRKAIWHLFTQARAKKSGQKVQGTTKSCLIGGVFRSVFNESGGRSPLICQKSSSFQDTLLRTAEQL